MSDSDDFHERFRSEMQERERRSAELERRGYWIIGGVAAILLIAIVFVALAYSNRLTRSQASFMENCVADRGEAKRYECRLLWSQTVNGNGNVSIQVTPAGSGSPSVVIRP